MNEATISQDELNKLLQESQKAKAAVQNLKQGFSRESIIRNCMSADMETILKEQRVSVTQQEVDELLKK